MNPLELAEEAKKQARIATNQFKSDNKSGPNRDPKKNGASEAVSSLQSDWTMKDKMAEEEGLRQIAAKTRAAKGGNCNEMSAVAAVVLLDHEETHPVTVVNIGGSGISVHTMVVVGAVAVGADGSLPKDMSSWGDDVAVCDPWANIACKAADYPQQWRDKMSKWSVAGKKVFIPMRGMVSPDQSMIKNAPGEFEKTAVFQTQGG
jgi:hypothetical protein